MPTTLPLIARMCLPWPSRSSTFFRRAASAALAVSLLLQVTAAGAASSASSSSSAPAQTVSRGSFLRAAISRLNIKLKKTGDMPYTGIPASLLPYARAAQELGALYPLASGDRINIERAITRGEALEVLTALARQTPKDVLEDTFTDVKTDGAKKAAAVAIERRWMRPFRSTFFGWNRPLTLAQEKALFRNATERAGVQVLPGQQIRIQINTVSPSLPKEEILDTVWDLIQRDYLYKDKIQNTEAGYSSVEGLVKSLDDPYTVFYRPSSAQEFQTQLKGEITGIGAQVEQKDGILIIVAPVTGSPAERAGLLAGDAILSVNGESLTGLSYEDAVNKVRGPKGSVANLHIRRNGNEMDVSVTRDVVRIADMEVGEQGGIAIVTLHQFGHSVNNEFRSKMKEVAATQPRGIVLDLRNNPGGLLDAAEVVVSAFLPLRSTYVKILTPNQETDEKTRGEPIFAAALPVVVLVNRGSASASEIVAGALQDHKRATVVGEKTFGKGTVQELVEFNDGSSLKMTIAEWHTPGGTKIEGIGVEPNITVPVDLTRDTQLLRALDLLR